MNPPFQNSDLIDNGHRIYTIDAHYVSPRLAAIFLIVGEGENGPEAALIETGTNLSWPYVDGALRQLGIAREQVRYVVPTHVHLDHAGGAGLLIEKLPAAKLVVHPRGARHLIAPARLFAATIAVYGEAKTRALYGTVTPVNADRVIEAHDGLQLTLGARRLTVLDTPGHAKHHICIVDGDSGGIFTGDLFGLSYRQLDVDGRASIMPTTTPSQFEPEAMTASIRRLLALKPPAMYLTHFGRVGEVERLGAELLRLLDRYLEIATNAGEKPAAERHALIHRGLIDLFLGEARAKRWPLDEKTLLDWLSPDLELNAQGLVLWLAAVESANAATVPLETSMAEAAAVPS